MKHPENKMALVFLSEELKRHEATKGHARIVIEVVDGKACQLEPGEKRRVQDMMKCS